MNANVISAIFRRNLLGYFNNPTGYLFICAFVFFSSIAAFWPAEFFSENLANLAQLNRWLPLILLGFIPAITMGIWSDERRQGTDELLLTIPATDFEVVLGKYLAAAGVYTFALLFSCVCNVLFLETLGSPDLGLLLANYFGYWVVGLAMLSIGMAASFLTGDLTVAFVLGVLFNLPLVGPSLVPFAPEWLLRFSLANEFRDFGRGVISLSSVAYFVSIIAIMLYLSMVFIGRRHWGGHHGNLAGHYLVRFGALLAIILSANVVLLRHNTLRADVTSERIASLSPQSRKLIGKIDAEHPVVIHAYYSKEVPESFAQTKLSLISMLEEIKAAGGDRIDLQEHVISSPFSEEAKLAEQQYDIRPVPVSSKSGGVRKQDDIFMGVAVTSGLETVQIPFFGKGLPVEYELIRSISTVTQQARKKIGVVKTDAKLFGGFDMQSMASSSSEAIIDELRKQYEVVEVDANSPIVDSFDVLMAVQPSSLSPEALGHFTAAVKRGQPTAIFEDPFPYMTRDVVGTDAPKKPAGGMNPFMQQPPAPKGNIKPLWDMLGVNFTGSDVIWQKYNPYPKLEQLVEDQPEWVFIDRSSGAKQPFNPDSLITKDLGQVLFLFAGAVKPLNVSRLKFTPLCETSTNSGTVPADKILESSGPFGGGSRFNPDLPNEQVSTGDDYVIAAAIRGKLPADKPMQDEGSPAAAAKAAAAQSAAASGAAAQPGEPAVSAKAEPDKPAPAVAKPADREINVVLVADIDCIYSAFFLLRARGQEDEDSPDNIDFQFDNVTFVLNLLDSLAGDDRFIDIRGRKMPHRLLTKLDQATQQARDTEDAVRKDFNTEFKTAQKREQKKFDDELARLGQRKGVNELQRLQETMMAKDLGQRRLATRVEQLRQERDRAVKEAQRESDLSVRGIENSYKAWAGILPPVLPLVVALGVYLRRKSKETEGVARTRLR